MTDKLPDGSDSIDQLARAAWPIRAMSWRRRRDTSFAIWSHLNRELGDEKAAAIARAITGVEAKLWMMWGEAVESLRKLGVKKGKRFLHRLSHKASLSPAHQITVHINAQGDWNSPESPPTNAVAEITATHTDTIRFLIKPLTKQT